MGTQVSKAKAPRVTNTPLIEATHLPDPVGLNVSSVAVPKTRKLETAEPFGLSSTTQNADVVDKPADEARDNTNPVTKEQTRAKVNGSKPPRAKRKQNKKKPAPSHETATKLPNALVFNEAQAALEDFVVANKSSALTPDMIPLAHVGTVIAELFKYDTFADSEMTSGLWVLLSTFDPATTGYDILQAWFAEIGRCKFANLVAGLWKTFWKPGDVLSGKEDDLTLATNLKIVTAILISMADVSPEACASICECGLFEKLLAPLRGPVITPEALEAGNSVLEEAFFSLLSVIYNCVRNNSDVAKPLFRTAGGVELLAKYTSARKPLLRTLAIMTLSFAIEESENSLLCGSGSADALSLLNSLLKSALSSERHIVQDPDSFAISVTEIMQVLNRLAINDDNKLHIAQLGALPFCKQVIDKPASARELLLTVRLLWALSFKEQNVERFEQMQELVESIKLLAAGPVKDLGHVAAGIVWNLDVRKRKSGATVDQSSHLQAQTGKQQHVMISYDWGHQDVVLVLNSGLQAAGYATWMDVDKMKGSTDDAMAKAIEDAAVVIVCVSERYKNSFNCRKEADYASECEKIIIPVITQAGYKADGWLAIQIAGKLRFDCSSREKALKALPCLINELGLRGKVGEQLKLNSAAVRSAVEQTTSTKLRPPIKQWTHAEVSDWLRRAKLDALAPKFEKFDGTMLSALCKMYRKAPAVFYDQAARSLGATSLPDLLALSAAIDELH